MRREAVLLKLIEGRRHRRLRLTLRRLRRPVHDRSLNRLRGSIWNRSGHGSALWHRRGSTLRRSARGRLLRREAVLLKLIEGRRHRRLRSLRRCLLNSLRQRRRLRALRRLLCGRLG